MLETEAFTRTKPPHDPTSIEPLRRAVLYLRVSTKSQVTTDYDPEGISLPAQRRACERRAEQLDNIVVVDEYVEPGESGRSTQKRPAFQAMLNRLRTEGDIDTIIVYKLSRLHRNRVDDALTMMELRNHGVQLISATESIDESPVGQLMHGILASFNEYRSAEDGADIRYKMAQKAKKGGTLGRAKLGYLNERERIDGSEVRTIVVDPERGPLITLAFELYATGDYTLAALADELTNRGLVTRPSRYPAGPISDSKLSELLRDRYYLGYVTYKGEEYPGRHEPLVDSETFERVQEVRQSRSVAGERQRRHRHYLRGTVWCGACHQRGVQSRLQLTVNRGNGGVYEYFRCTGTQRNQCDARHVPVELVEDAVADYYWTIEFEPDLIAGLRRSIHDTLADANESVRLERAQLQKQLDRLDVAEANLLDLIADGTALTNKIRTRLHDIQTRRSQVSDQMDTIQADLGEAAALLDHALAFLAHPGDLYAQITDKVRRQVNQAVFEKIYIHDDTVTDDELREPFAELLALQRLGADAAPSEEDAGGPLPATRGVPRYRPASKAALLHRALSEDHGSSKAAMVELRGIEPLTSSMPWKRSAN